VFSLVCFFFPLVTVIPLEPWPPLPPHVRFSRATPDIVLLITSISNGGAGASTLPAPPLCAVYSFFRFGGCRHLNKVQSLILCSPIVHLAIRFAIFSPVDILSSSSDALSILRPAAVFYLSYLFARCLVAVDFGLRPLCHCCIPSLSNF
jgi:hypothetical protein